MSQKQEQLLKARISNLEFALQSVITAVSEEASPALQDELDMINVMWLDSLTPDVDLPNSFLVTADLEWNN